ncbi:MAG: hypothetical protein MHMPM18_001532 [Marteilia pararefringens]
MSAFNFGANSSSNRASGSLFGSQSNEKAQGTTLSFASKANDDNSNNLKLNTENTANTGEKSSGTSFLFGSTASADNSKVSMLNTPPESRLTFNFDIAKKNNENSENKGNVVKRTMNGISILSETDEELHKQHKEKLSNELLPKELINSVRELEKELIKKDKASIFLQNLFNINDNNSIQLGSSSNDSNILSNLNLLEKMSKECDYILEDKVHQQKELDKCASSLIEQSSLLNFCLRKMGVSAATGNIVNSSTYNRIELSDKYSKLDLMNTNFGVVINSYLSENLKKNLSESNLQASIMNSCKIFIENLIFPKNHVDFLNASTHQLNKLMRHTDEISTHMQKFDSNQQRNQEIGTDRNLGQRIANLFGQDNHKIDNMNLHQTKIEDKLGPSPFCEISNYPVGKKEEKRVTFSNDINK